MHFVSHDDDDFPGHHRQRPKSTRPDAAGPASSHHRSKVAAPRGSYYFRRGLRSWHNKTNAVVLASSNEAADLFPPPLTFFPSRTKRLPTRPWMTDDAYLTYASIFHEDQLIFISWLGKRIFFTPCFSA